jgi:hypothetical protein
MCERYEHYQLVQEAMYCCFTKIKQQKGKNEIFKANILKYYLLIDPCPHHMYNFAYSYADEQ